MDSHTKHVLLAFGAFAALACSSSDRTTDDTATGGSSEAGGAMTGGASNSAGTNTSGGLGVGGAAHGGASVGTGGSLVGNGGRISTGAGGVAPAAGGAHPGAGGSVAPTAGGAHPGAGGGVTPTAGGAHPGAGGGVSPAAGGSIPGAGGVAPAAGGSIPGAGGIADPAAGGSDPGAGGNADPAAGGTDPGAGGGSSEVGGTTGSGGSTTGVSPGCDTDNTTSPCGEQGTMCSMDVAGVERTYYVQLPSSYVPGTPYPVIFQFHPWGGSADGALTMYQLNSKIPDAIYVTPQGLKAGDSPGWANEDGRDIEFTKLMVAEVEAKYCVDTSRIFSTGFSYGGMMSFAIGCEMSDVFRAIAPMSGSLYSDVGCQGTGPHIAMWGSHGKSDGIVPLEDGQSALAKILKENNCGTETVPVDPSPCVKYQGCDPGYDVTWCEWDGDHGIPSFGSSAIADFFKQF